MTRELFGLLSFARGTDLRDASVRIARHAVKRGLGILFGLENIPSYTTDEKLEILHDIINETSNALPFELTSDPLDNNIEDVFEAELNDVRGVDPSKSRLIGFFRDTWGEPDLLGMSIILYDGAGIQRNELRRVSLALEGFMKHLTNYYKIEATAGSDVADGIFDVKKELRDFT